MRKVKIVILGLVVATAPVLVQTQAETIDPCADELGAATDGEHICLNGETIAIAPRDASNASKVETSGTTFVTADIHENGRWGTIQNSTGTDLTYALEDWSPLLPGGRGQSGNTTSGDLIKAHTLLPMNKQWENELIDRGVSVVTAFGGNWYIVNASGAEEGWEDVGFIDITSDFPVEQQYDADLPEESGMTPIAALAYPATEEGTSGVAATLDAHGAENVTERPGPGIVIGRLDANHTVSVAEDSSVMWLEDIGNNWTLHNDVSRDLTRAENVHNHETGNRTGEGVTSLIFDFSLLWDHQELSSSYISNQPLASENPDYDGEGDITNHGTKVAGSVLADGEEEKEITKDDSKYEGIAPNASFVFSDLDKTKIHNDPEDSDNGPDHFSRYAAASASSSAYPETELVVSTAALYRGDAWLSEPGKYDLGSYEMDRIVADLGLSVFQSAGNDGPRNLSTEGVAENTVSVGGIYHRDSTTWEKHSWSDGGDAGEHASTGPAADGRIKPDLVGPYDRISTSSNNDVGQDTVTDAFGGTSAATPIVAGVGALTEEMYEKGVFRNATGDITKEDAEPSTIKAILANTAHSYDRGSVSMAIGQDGARHMRDVQGWGFPDAGEMYTHGRYSVTVNEDYSLAPGSEFVLKYDLPDDDPDNDGTDEENITGLAVSLAWTTQPTLPKAHEVHEVSPHNRSTSDLDLIVEAPDGTKYLGNKGLNGDSSSNPGGQQTVDSDRKNSLENVLLPSIDDQGEWTVTVSAKNVDNPYSLGPADAGQEFSLIVRPIRGDVECCPDTVPDPELDPDVSIDLRNYFDWHMPQ